MGYKLNGVNTGGIPDHIVLPLIGDNEIKYLVETGTASGDSARWAANHFEKVWTIEVIEGRAKEDSFPENIVFLEGDSSERLTEVISELNTLKGDNQRQWVLFYLDAHYSGDTPNESGYPECPLLQEIECVAKYGEDAIIIIDDARLFLGPPPYPHDPTQWPSVLEIFLLLSKYFPYSWVTIMDDYIVSIPLHVRDVLWGSWRERFQIRYPNAEDKLKTQVKDVYNAFKKYLE